MNNKRILWIFNHTSVRNFEVPLMMRMGYEVYCPKFFNMDFEGSSTSISYEYDKSLSLPEEIINKLNTVNFYKKLDAETVTIINEYFDIAFCSVDEEPLNTLLYKFEGIIVLRAFGLVNERSYAQIIESSLGSQALRQIVKLGNRFWFSHAYDDLKDNEPEVFKRRSLYMPIGLIEKKDKWIGGAKEIYFIAPEIKTNSYYNKIYQDFCDDFGDIPHVIGGEQLIPINDDNTVVGALTEDKNEYNMRHLAAIYYPSQECRYLHYNLIEAIGYGMPLVFMSGGMLDNFGGIKSLGRCKTKKEARKKLLRLSNGDIGFANKIVSSQRNLLERFKEKNVTPFWEEAFERIDYSANSRIDNNDHIKKIAVILPASYTGGVLDYSIRFCKSLKYGMDKEKDICEITFLYPEDEIFDNNFEINSLARSGIYTRTFKTEIRTLDWVEKYYQTMGYDLTPTCASLMGKVCIIRDNVYDLNDFDYAFITADVSPKNYPLFINIPHAVVAHDYIQHYVKGLFSTKDDYIKLSNQRQADCVLVTSEPTLKDAYSYAGLDEDRVLLTPYMLEMMDYRIENISFEEKFFVWSTNAARHKNHINALHGLIKYYENGGELDCCITGTNTLFFRSDVDLNEAPVDTTYVNEVRELLVSNEQLIKHIHIKGNLPKASYAKLLSCADFIFHPGYGDNGNGSVYDAVAMSVPGLVSDYPTMRYLADFINAPMHYMNPFDPDDICRALIDMEKNAMMYKNELPIIDIIKQADYREKGLLLYKTVKEIVKI